MSFLRVSKNWRIGFRRRNMRPPNKIRKFNHREATCNDVSSRASSWAGVASAFPAGSVAFGFLLLVGLRPGSAHGLFVLGCPSLDDLESFARFFHAAFDQLATAIQDFNDGTKEKAAQEKI